MWHFIMTSIWLNFYDLFGEACGTGSVRVKGVWNLGNVAFKTFFFLSRYLDGFEFNFSIRIFSENFSLSTPETSHNSLNLTIKKHSEKLFFVCSCLYSLSNSHIYLKKLETKKIIINKFSFTCFIFYVFKKSTKVFFFQ